MKRTMVVGVLCACLGVAAGAAWGGAPPPGKGPNPKLMSALASGEKSLQDMAGVPPDPSGHLKKAADYMRKAIDEMREAMGMGHHAHSHDKD